MKKPGVGGLFTTQPARAYSAALGPARGI